MKQTLLAVTLSVIAALAVTHFAALKSTAPTAQPAPTAASAYDRVMKTNTLRCGYILFPPQFNKDPNTGKMSGIAYDIVEGMAQRLGVKVEWTEEANFATMNAGLENGRFDSLCFTLYRWVPSARAVDYSVPLFCSPTHIYVRADDHRFDANTAALNDAAVKLGVVDGEGANAIAAEDFPAMNVVGLPQGTDLGVLFEGLASNKYDAVFANPLMAAQYVASNPGKIKNITPDAPIRTYCHSLAFKKGEHDLINTVNLALEEMLNFGTIDKILKSHEPMPGSFFRIARPYQTPQK